MIGKGARCDSGEWGICGGDSCDWEVGGVISVIGK